VQLLFTEIIKYLYINYSRIYKSMSSFYQKWKYGPKNISSVFQNDTPCSNSQIRKAGK